MKWFLLFFLSGIVVFVTTLYFRLGGYKEVVISPPESKEFYLLYKKHLGPYHKIAPVIESVENWAHQKKIDCPATFGEYLDDPQKVDNEDRLRSRGGCVLNRPLEELEEEDLFFDHKSERTYVKAIFDGAPSISPFKVYPKVSEWLQQNRLKISGPVIEIYHVEGTQGLTTEYYFPVE